MKRLFIAFAGSALLIGLFAANTLKPTKTAPPGTVRLKDKLYIDCGPIRNIDYLEFLNFSKTANWEKFFAKENLIPAFGLKWDSLAVLLHDYPSDSKFLKQFVPADSVIEIYSKDIMTKKTVNPFRYKDLNNYPIVNISYEQAMKFCEWRSKMVSVYMAIDSKTAEEREKKYYKKVSFRLPTQEEWELSMKNFSNEKDLKKREFMEGKPLSVEMERSSKFSWKPFSITEMLSEKGKSEGLSYKDIMLKDIRTIQNYAGPQPWVGFRCVCDVE